MTTREAEQMSDQTYNGWTNRETWLVNLWLSNDEGTYRAVNELVETTTEEHDPDGLRELRGEVADAIAGFVEEMPEYLAATEDANFVNDLLTTALGRVDWYEIAGAWMES